MMHLTTVDDKITPRMVWYDVKEDEIFLSIHEDEIFLSIHFDYCFYALADMNVDNIDLLGML